MPPVRKSKSRASGGNAGKPLLWLLLAMTLGGIGWLWWRHRGVPPAPVREKVAPAPTRPAPTNIPVLKLPPEALIVRTSVVPVAPIAVVATNPAPAAPAPSAAPSPATVASNAIAAAMTPTVKYPVAGAALSVTSAPVRLDLPGRPVRSVYEAQVALARRGISSGSIDGSIGTQTRSALRAFQEAEKLAGVGELDEETKQNLRLIDPPERLYVVSSNDLARLLPVGATWLGKSQQERLDYETILEMAAEKGHAHPSLIRALNPKLDWTNLVAGTVIRIPNADYPPARRKAAFVRIRLSAKTLQAFDAATNLLAHFPCSIARKVEKRPVGELVVEKVALGPNYRFDPEVFPESVEARGMSRPLMIPPGPNNPVGTAWIGLSKPGYGIHGTPRPEEVGRTESHGCFRLANWNAEYLAQLVSVGMPVLVEP